jgi:BirA family transcriptional regulator, biotin operon repressor / biotin---[acetyl-CoA-carboxylase] ligase
MSVLTAPPTLSIESIRSRLAASTVARQLYLFGEVSSTNAALKQLAVSGAAEGTVVLAETQKAGRGRMGQPWFSPAGVNLYASVLFRGSLTPAQAPVFSLIAGLALADAVKDLGAQPGIKWPNDVLVDGRKVGGSLAECSVRDGKVDYLILGVGANLNVESDALRAALGSAADAATSLCVATGRTVDRNAFAATYLNALEIWTWRFRAKGPAAILAGWRDRDILTGRRVEIRGHGIPVIGRVAGLDEQGHLVVRGSLGERRVVSTEEICFCD